MTLTVDYHGIKSGMEFKEAHACTKPRRVVVVDPRIYHALVTIVEGRDQGKQIQVFNKQLCNPVRWTRIK